jgi:hypothetical protein
MPVDFVLLKPAALRVFQTRKGRSTLSILALRFPTIGSDFHANALTG